MKYHRGNIGELMSVGICTLSLMTMMLAFLDCVELLEQKNMVSQLARKYILRMETVGLMRQEDCVALTTELENLGVTDIIYDGTTFHEVGYGEAIALKIQGQLKGGCDFVETRVSTAKN